MTAPRCVTIHHPQNGETLNTVSFLGYGKATGKCAQLNLAAHIKSPAGTIVKTGTLVQDPPEWIFVFDTVPDGQGYQLEVIDRDTGDVLDEVHGLKIGATHAVGIMHPAPNTTVCRSFGAYGGRTAGEDVNCVTIASGGGETIGTALPMMPSNMWGASFYNIETGPNYSVEARVNGVPQDTHTGITIQTC